MFQHKSLSEIKTGLLEKKPDKQHLILYLIETTVALVAITYISGVLAQFAAAYNKYQKSNGLFTGANKEVLKWPNLNFFYCIRFALTTHIGNQLILAIIVLSIMALIYIAIQNKKKSSMDDRNFQQSEKGTYGTSGWMENPCEVFDVKPITETYGNILGSLGNCRKIVSMPLDTHYNKNIAVFGAPGVGKTTCFVYNQIMQSAKRGESVIVTDPKGEVFANTSQYMKNKGYVVKIFNLVNPRFSDSWNCLGEIKNDDDLQMNAQIFVNSIMENTTVGKEDQFWGKAEMNFLKAHVLYVVLEEPPEHRNMGYLYDLMTATKETELRSKFDKLEDGNAAKMAFNLYLKAAENDKVAGGVQMGVGGRLQVFQTDVIRSITSYDEIDLSLPAKQKCAYYICISDQDSTYQFLSSLFFSFLFIDIIRYADTFGVEGKCDVPVNLILDEFTNIGSIYDYTKKLSTVRSRLVAITMIFQCLPQLENRYPMNMWKEILGDCDTQLFLGGTDDVTCKYISDMSGELTIAVASEAKNFNSVRMTDYVPNYKETASVGKRMLLTTDEVRRLPNEYALVILRCQKFLKVNKFYYKDNPESKNLQFVNVRDHVPEWSLHSLTKNIQSIKEAKKNKAPTHERDYVPISNHTQASTHISQATKQLTLQDIARTKAKAKAENEAKKARERKKQNEPKQGCPDQMSMFSNNEPENITKAHGYDVDKKTGEVINKKDASDI